MKYEIYSPRAAQIERGLTDEYPYVRKAFAERADYTPTAAQIERGLTDEDPDVRVAFAYRTDHTPMASC